MHVIEVYLIEWAPLERLQLRVKSLILVCGWTEVLHPRRHTKGSNFKYENTKARDGLWNF